MFVPIVFTEGIASEVFKEMALTVTFSLLASLAVALTIVPMLSSKMLNVSSEKEGRNSLLSKIINVWDRAINGLDDIYRVVLKGVLNSRLITIILTIIISGASIATVFFIGTEFIPSTDQGLLTVSIDMGDGILLEETDEVVKKVEEIVDKIPEVEIVFTTVGGSSSNVMSMGTESSSASVDVTLKPLSDRSKSTSEIVEMVRKEVEKIPGADITVRDAGMDMLSMMGSPIAVQIYGDDLNELNKIAYEVKEIIESVEGTRQVETSVSKGRLEAGVYVNRDKASLYGLSTIQVASAISTSLKVRWLPVIELAERN